MMGKRVFAAAVSALILGAAPAMATPMPGSGDQFLITFGPNGAGTLNACLGGCSFGLGADNGSVVTNVGGEGGNGYDFKLPETVSTGIVDVYSSSNVLTAVLDFIDSTDLDYIVSGTLTNYASPYSLTALANGSFSYLGPYPTNNQYNGVLPSLAPEPTSLGLFAAAVAGLLLVRRRPRRAH